MSLGTGWSRLHSQQQEPGFIHGQSKSGITRIATSSFSSLVVPYFLFPSFVLYFPLQLLPLLCLPFAPSRKSQGQVVKACSYEPQDLGLSIVALVIPSLAVFRVSNGTVNCGRRSLHILSERFLCFCWCPCISSTIFATLSLSLMSEFLLWSNLEKSSSHFINTFGYAFNFWGSFWFKIQVTEAQPLQHVQLRCRTYRLCRG